MHRLVFLRKMFNMRKQTGGLCWQLPAESRRISSQHHKSLSKRGPPVCAVHHRLSTVTQLLLCLFPTKLHAQGIIRSSRTKQCKIRPDARAQAVVGDWLSEFCQVFP